jgi:hypothetical protein
VVLVGPIGVAGVMGVIGVKGVIGVDVAIDEPEISLPDKLDVNVALEIKSDVELSCSLNKVRRKRIATSSEKKAGLSHLEFETTTLYIDHLRFLHV